MNFLIFSNHGKLKIKTFVISNAFENLRFCITILFVSSREVCSCTAYVFASNFYIFVRTIGLCVCVCVCLCLCVCLHNIRNENEKRLTEHAQYFKLKEDLGLQVL